MIYDANAYDALWVAALTENLSGCINLEKLKENFINITKSFPGASGDIKLDDNGDRIGKYDFWTVMKSHSKDFEWEKIHYTIFK
jgi:ABC-type branched-subunit amino acid transport system substrate-binding protein